MIAIVCIDDNLGTAFNNRRQSRDSALIKKIIGICKNSVLWISEYSAELFSEYKNHDIIADNSFADKAGTNDFCFFETVGIKAYEKNIEKLIVFKWNRLYPSDNWLDISLSDKKLIQTEEFQGNSHEKITMEIYDMRKE